MIEFITINVGTLIQRSPVILHPIDVIYIKMFEINIIFDIKQKRNVCKIINSHIYGHTFEIIVLL